MTHSILVARATTWLRRNGFKVALPEVYTIGGEIPDAWGLDSCGDTCVIEVKVSRADFLRDRKKYHRRRPEVGMGNWRYYMAPVGLIKPEELPECWGLLEVHGRIIKKAVQAGLNQGALQHKVDMAFMYSILRRLDCAGILRDGLQVAKLQIKVRTEREKLKRELHVLKRRAPEALPLLSGEGR